jgi:predicted aspartyl protease
MGHVRVSVEIVNPVDRSRSVKVESALVDTGATRTTISRDLARQLDLEIRGAQQVRTAAGATTIDRSFAMILLEGRESIADIWVSDDYPGVLIGVITLEAMGLGVDPKNQRLIDVEQLLL